METNAQATTGISAGLSSEDLLQHFQGHRNLSRKVIEACPEDKLFTHTIGGMRSLGELAMELNRMAAPGMHGVATGEWLDLKDLAGDSGLDLEPRTKAGVLAIWDWATGYINEIWKQLKPGRLQEPDKAYGVYEGIVWDLFFYIVDNEIHHRGQAYVYLRSLGIEPPLFWER